MHVRQTIKEEEDGDTEVRGGAGRNPRFDERYDCHDIGDKNRLVSGRMDRYSQENVVTMFATFFRGRRRLAYTFRNNLLCRLILCSLRASTISRPREQGREKISDVISLFSLGKVYDG